MSSIDPIEQAIDVVMACWPHEEKKKETATSDIEYAIATAMCAQEANDWLVASVYSYTSKDSPKSFVVILWRPMNSAEIAAKIQIKPVMIHWDVEVEKFVVVNMMRLQ